MDSHAGFCNEPGFHQINQENQSYGIQGYRATVAYDAEAEILHGEVIDTNDVITFQGKSVDKLELAFQCIEGHPPDL